MRLLYDILAIILVIGAIPIFLYRLWREYGFGNRLKQSFGFLPEDVLEPVAGKKCIWIHAASVGEIVATSPIVKEIRQELPGRRILVSVVTASGYEMAKQIIHEADSIIFFPWDIPWLPGAVIKKVKPAIFLPVETELWPNFLQAIHRLNVPAVMVNGRISDKSVNRYSYLRGILTDMLATVDRFCMQSVIDAQYIIRLGASPRKVFVTGNTKFDQTYTDITEAEKNGLVLEFGFSGRSPVLVAGSTHDGEEEILLEAFKQVRALFPVAGLILAPRDILRADELVTLTERSGLAAVRRTAVAEASAGHDVMVLDTIGELGKVYGIGEIVYVGGSLVPHGGHNLLEPAAHGKPILVGPHMFNFKDSYALFTDRGACDTVYDGDELAEKMLNILQDDELKAQMASRSLAIINENRGAAQKSVHHIKQVLTLFYGTENQA